jgi:hypothetical protein
VVAGERIYNFLTIVVKVVKEAGSFRFGPQDIIGFKAPVISFGAVLGCAAGGELPHLHNRIL